MKQLDSPPLMTCMDLVSRLYLNKNYPRPGAMPSTIITRWEEPSNRAAHRVARHYGLRTVRYKLIYYYDLGEWEFFDLKDDPREMTNLYESPSQQKRVAELKKRLTGLRTKYADDTGKDW